MSYFIRLFSMIMRVGRSALSRLYRNWHLILLVLGIFFAITLIAKYTIFAPPRDFPSHRLVQIPEGVTITQIADGLREIKVIRSARLFRFFLFFYGSPKAGDYFFESPIFVGEAASRIATASYGLTPVKVTLAEGRSVKEIAELLSPVFPLFDDGEFIKIATSKEGYLFPDTYFFLPNVRAHEVVGAMEKNFRNKITPVDAEIEIFGRSLHEIITMASILEEEARKFETRRVIAGILWKRLSLGMPLQVDAVFSYIIGKTIYPVSLENLQIDSPYNTYKYKGLPPGPITNPGLDSIKAALAPIETKYLYYLTDKNGIMRYAITHDEHVANKERYLR